MEFVNTLAKMPFRELPLQPIDFQSYFLAKTKYRDTEKIVFHMGHFQNALMMRGVCEKLA